MYILGISCFYHDAAACLLKDGRVIAAAQEERFTRKKHDQEFPINAIRYCLTEESRVEARQTSPPPTLQARPSAQKHRFSRYVQAP